MNGLYDETKELLSRNIEALECIAKELLAKESLCDEDIDRLIL